MVDLGSALRRRAPALPAAPPAADRAESLYRGIAALGDVGGIAAPGDLTRFEARVFSQNGEDGVVAELLRRVGVVQRWFVEFGVGSGVQGNCVALADVLGWTGLFIECDEADHRALASKYAGEPRVRTRRARVDAGNVEAHFVEAGVPVEPDVVSIDVDGNDWWIWRALRTFRPRLVVVEYNANLPIRSLLVKPYDPAGEWDGTSWFGASLGAFEHLAAEKGYTLAHTDLRGVNAFFVRDDLLGAVGPLSPPRRAANYDLCGGGFPDDPASRPWIDLADGDPD